MATVLVSSPGETLIAGEAPPPSSNQQEVQLKFLLTGLLSGLPLPPFSIRMCPPLTTKNINHYQPLLATGRCSNNTPLTHANTQNSIQSSLIGWRVLFPNERSSPLNSASSDLCKAAVICTTEKIL